MIPLYWIYSFTSGIFLFFLLLPFLVVLFSRFFKEDPALRVAAGKFTKPLDYAHIITAYKNAEIAKPLVVSLLKQGYQQAHIYLVADECDISGWDLRHEKLTVLRPDPPLRLKAKSIIHAIENFVRPHDYCIIYDADNLAHPEFLDHIHRYASHGHKAIQGQRTAKNLDTKYAAADSLGEFYKNYTERYAPYLIGSSAVISGSGMAVETELYKAYLASPEIEQGKHLWKKMLQEDKILQNFLLRLDEKIVYAWEAIVYDEKVTTGDAVETQRSRWLYSYFQNMKNAIGILRRGLMRFSWNQFLFGWITISPPLFILMGISFLLMMAGWFIHPPIAISFVFAFAVFVLNLLWTLQLSKVPPTVWQAVGSTPLFVWRQFKGMFKMVNPNKHFKHTEHAKPVDIDEVLKNR